MQKIADFIVNKKYIVLLIYALIIIYAIFGISRIQVIDDMSAFVPDETVSAIEILNEEFDGFRTTRILVVDINLEDATALHGEIEGLPTVKLFAFNDTEHFKDNNALFNIVFTQDATQEDFLFIIELIQEQGSEVFVPQPLFANSVNIIQGYMPIIIILAIIIILVVLIATTTSYLIPIIFLITFIAAILINIGTNFWFGPISMITMLITPLIQLLLGIDFANILNNCFEEEKEHYDDKKIAMTNAIKKAIPEIVTAGSTTVLGFLALAVMTLGIGQDLGLVLGKGILISIISAITLFPALLLIFSKISEKAKHERFIPNVKPLARFSVKNRFVLAPLFLITAAVFTFFALTANYYFSANSLDSSNPTETQIAIDEANNIFGYNNQIFVIIPNTVSEDDISIIYELINDMDEVNSIISNLSELVSDNYIMMIVNFSLPVEGYETFVFIENLINEVTEVVPYALFNGESVRLFYIKSSFSGDYQLITIITFFVLLGVLLLMFKRVKYPILFTIIVQLVILMNFGLAYILGNQMFYMTIILVVAIQKAFTFDYAVVLASRYEVLKETKKPEEAIEFALQESYPNIMASGAIIAILSFIMTIIVNDPMLSQFTLSLAFGALLAVAFVSLILPGIIYTVVKPSNKVKEQ